MTKSINEITFTLPELFEEWTHDESSDLYFVETSTHGTLTYLPDTNELIVFEGTDNEYDTTLEAFSSTITPERKSISIDLSNTYLGFTSNIKPMQAAKKEATLDKLIRYNGKVSTQKQFIFDLLSNGHTLAIDPNYSYYSRKIDGMTKPKTVYRITNEEGTGYTITKTEYDFAQYILSNDFLNPITVESFITNERIQREAEELAEQKRIQLEREEKERIRQEEESKRKAELQAKQSNWIEQGKLYMTDEVKQVIVNMVESNWNYLSTLSINTTKSILIDNLINKFAMYLGNRKGIESLMYSYSDNETNYTIDRNITMYFEQEFLTKVFSLNKGDHGNTINAKVRSFYDNKEYKSSTPKETTLEEVYILDTNTKEFTPTEGEKHIIQGITCYLVAMEGKYKMIEARTGMLLLQPCTNKTDAIKLTRQRIKANKDKIHNVIDQAINRFGLSPLYANEQAM